MKLIRLNSYVLFSLIFVMLPNLVRSSNQMVDFQSIEDVKRLGVTRLVNYELDSGYMVIKVLSSGCTGTHSFKVEVENQELNLIKVMRIKKDECGMKPRSIELQYSIRHLGLDLRQPIKLLNRLVKGQVTNRAF